MTLLTVNAGLEMPCKTPNSKSLDGVEAAAAELIDLSPETACASQTLVTMMLLSGVADSSQNMVYALIASHVYEQLGDE